MSITLIECMIFFLPDVFLKNTLGSCYIIDSENSGLVSFERNFDGKTLRQTTYILSAENALWESMCVVKLWFDSAWNK